MFTISKNDQEKMLNSQFADAEADNIVSTKVAILITVSAVFLASALVLAFIVVEVLNIEITEQLITISLMSFLSVIALYIAYLMVVYRYQLLQLVKNNSAY